jgi:peptidoglycan/xylan/chitin deacetylase (PgdA/CDA1 family)
LRGEHRVSHYGIETGDQELLAAKSKRFFKKALIKTSILRAASRFSPPAAAILAYHSVVENPDLTDYFLGASRSLADFEKHVEILALKFSPVTIAEVAAFAASGRPLPRHAVAVTFDDGFADNHDIALPVLARFGVPATFYIMFNSVETGTLPWYCRIRFAFHTTKIPQWTHPQSGRIYNLTLPGDRQDAMQSAWDRGAALTGRVQDEFIDQIERSLETDPTRAHADHGLMMTWDQVRALKNAGHTIGAHTLSHPNVSQVTPEEARHEIAGSKQKLEEKIAQPIEHFSYPHPALNPHWSPQTLQILKESGFQSAVLTTPGPVRPNHGPLVMKRQVALLGH